MLESRYLRDNLEEAGRRLATRGGEVDLSDFTGFDARRRDLLGEAEALKAERNQVSALIGKTKDKSQVQGEIVRMKEVSGRIKELDDELRQVDEALQSFLLTLPNFPHPQTPLGSSEEENVEVSSWGEIPSFDFEVCDHVDVGEKLGILDFERAGKLSEPGFHCFVVLVPDSNVH